MKRLLMPAVGIAVTVVMSGCNTPDAKFQGLTTTDGKAIVLVEPGESTAAETKPVDNTKSESFKDRQAAQRNGKVKITRTDAELAIDLQEQVQDRVKSEFRKHASGANVIQEVLKRVTFVNGRVQVEKSVISRLAGRAVQPGTVLALQALIADETARFFEQEIYPKMAAAQLARIRPAVEKCVAEGQYANARELIWRASMFGCEKLDAMIRAETVKLMHLKVNPANWNAVEPKINAISKKAVSGKTYDAGIAELKKLAASSLEKEYSVLLDKKMQAVAAELKKLGVPEADMKPVLEKQEALIAAAENIKDVCDRLETLVAAKTGSFEKEPRKDPALAEYYKRIDEFHATLLRLDCTKPNADKIVTDLDRDLLALVDLLRKAAVMGTSTEKGQTELSLGTKSLNDRITAAIQTEIAKLEKLRDAELLVKAKAELEAKVKELVAAGQFEEAREEIWNASVSGRKNYDAEMFAFGLTLLRNHVNPADWNRIEKEITDKFAELSKSGAFDELHAFLNGYPLIRQHSVKLDEQLAKVREEAEKLGADPEQALNAARAACGMVEEANDLVDHLDRLVADAAEEGKAIDKSQLQKELTIYAVKLAAYHATPENVQQIVEKLTVALDALIANPTNPKSTHLELGTNAVNDRTRKLIAKLLADLPGSKEHWQNGEYKRISAELEKNVRLAVKEARFDDARNLIRDEKLIGREDLDLQLYNLRVGLLDSCVNPAQLDSLLAGIDAKIKAFKEADDHDGALAYIAEYPFVHDQYESIESALAAVKNAMVALEISEAESGYDEKVRFFNSIQEVLEKRRESWKPERDLKEVEKALQEVCKALFDHLNKHKGLIEKEKEFEFKHILADLSNLDRTVTTWELNARLRARLDEAKPHFEAAKETARIAALLKQIDADVSFDSQIAMAEEAISRQLGIKCDRASFKVNALMGAYARVFRLLKKAGKGGTATAEQATTMLVGAAYLGQSGVIKHALTLGADINGVCARDPLGRTALALAIDAGNSSLVKELVDAGASLTATDKEGNAVVHYAAKSGNVSVLKAVTASAPVTVKNNAGDTPLAVAVVRNQPAVVDALVAAVAEDGRAAFVNNANTDGDTAFDIAARFGSRDVLDTLVKAGAEYTAKDLVIAAEADHVAIAQWLINQGLDVNADGVMRAACPKTATGRYLIGEGGIVPAEHACAKCAEAAAPAAVQPAPVPAEVLIVPQTAK